MKKSVPMPVAIGVAAVVLIGLSFFLYKKFFIGDIDYTVPTKASGHVNAGTMPASMKNMTREEGMKFMNGGRGPQGAAGQKGAGN